MKQMYVIIATVICCSIGLFAQTSPYVSSVLEYKPVPGLNRMCGWPGEVSTEICGVVDVDPNGT